MMDYIDVLVYIVRAWWIVFLSPRRPDGEKKAYVRLAPDYDALDVANKVREKALLIRIFIFPTRNSSHPLRFFYPPTR